MDAATQMREDLELLADDAVILYIDEEGFVWADWHTD